jgi:hypothetical protein
MEVTGPGLISPTVNAFSLYDKKILPKILIFWCPGRNTKQKPAECKAEDLELDSVCLAHDDE